MRRSIMACALLALAATPSWAESAPSDPHHPPRAAAQGEAPASAPKQDQAPARPDLMQLMQEHGEMHTMDHGDDHSNCCKVKKPAQ